MIKVFCSFILGLLCFCFGAFLLIKNVDFSQADSPEFVFEKTKKIEAASANFFIYEGFIWLLSKDSNLLKLDLNCEILESYEIEFEDLSENFCIKDAVLYGVSKGKKIFAFDLKTKLKIWEFSCEKKIQAALSLTDNLVLFASYDSHIYAIEQDTGALNFKYAAGDAINEAVVIDEDKIYFGDCSGILTSFDMRTKSAICEEISEHLPYSPLILGDSLLILDYESTLFCLDKNTLKESWNLQIDAKTLCEIDNEIFAISPDLLLIDFENTKAQKLLSLDESIELIQALDSQTLALATNYGSFYIYDLEAKKMKFQYKFGLELGGVKIYDSKIFIRDTMDNFYIITRNPKKDD